MGGHWPPTGIEALQGVFLVKAHSEGTLCPTESIRNVYS